MNTKTFPALYELAVESLDVACEIRVNDVPVLRLPGGAVKTSFDVNSVVLHGPNALALRVRPGHGKTAMSHVSACRVTLGTKNQPGDDAQPVASLFFRARHGSPTGFEESPAFQSKTPPLVRSGEMDATQSFQLEAPFHAWFWTGARPIEPTEANRAEVVATYRHLHALLQSRDLPALIAACDQQARDWQLAYGLPDLESARKMLGIAQWIQNPNVEVEPFPDSHLTMNIFAHGRLVELLDADQRSPLRLLMKNMPYALARFNVVLCRDGAQWVIAR